MVSVGGQVLDQLGLVFLALRLEEGDGFVAVDHLALELGAAADDVAHLRFDGGEVVRGERLVAGEIVVEAVLDRRADGDLGAGIQILHRLGQHVGGVVADHVQRLGVAAGDEDDGGVVLDRGGEVENLAVELHRQGGAGEAGTDRLGHRGARHRRIELAHGTVGQGNGGHGSLVLMVVRGGVYGVNHLPEQGRRPREANFARQSNHESRSSWGSRWHERQSGHR